MQENFNPRKVFATRFITISFLILLLFLPLLASVFAQNLNRVSTATRSDGLGYVIRFHLSAAPDSFKIVQPNARLSQIAIYGQNMRMNQVEKSTDGPFTSFDLIPLRNGIGADLNLEPGHTYLSRAYMDQNRRDVLVAFTRVSSQELLRHTDGFRPVNWEPLRRIEPGSVAENDTLTSDWFIQDDDVRRSIKFNTVVIDPGHGGRDPGSLGSGGVHEKVIALEVSKRLGRYIEEHLPELKVVYTREDDRFVDLDERGRIANRNQGDLFISIHTNSARSRQAHGAEVYFLGMHRTQEAFETMKRENSVIEFEESADLQELSEEQLLIYELSNSAYMASSQRFAELIERQFALRAQRRSRGVKQAGFLVLYHASMPAVLVELGFISNREEERFMRSDYGQAILASAIFRAVRDYKELVERTNRN